MKLSTCFAPGYVQTMYDLSMPIALCTVWGRNFLWKENWKIPLFFIIWSLETFLDNELTTKWLNRLKATSTDPISREQHSQLESILNFYGNTSSGTANLKPIDWSAYEKNIHTPNVVAAIQAKYDEFMQAEFEVAGAVAKCGTRSEAMKSLDTAMHYNYQLWMVHYLMHLDQM